MRPIRVCQIRAVSKGQSLNYILEAQDTRQILQSTSGGVHSGGVHSGDQLNYTLAAEDPKQILIYICGSTLGVYSRGLHSGGLLTHPDFFLCTTSLWHTLICPFSNMSLTLPDFFIFTICLWHTLIFSLWQYVFIEKLWGSTLRVYTLGVYWHTLFFPFYNMSLTQPDSLLFAICL